MGHAKHEFRGQLGSRIFIVNSCKFHNELAPKMITFKHALSGVLILGDIVLIEMLGLI